MLGAIAGDIIGSVYEWENCKSEEFELFQRYSQPTDDSILSVATADAILTDEMFAERYRYYANRYPDKGYGMSFTGWAQNPLAGPYNSWGNGSAMRVSPIGWAYNSLDKTLEMAKKSAEVSHNHPEGIKGAQAIAAAIWLARKGNDKDFIKDFIVKTFSYDLDRKIEDIRPMYEFDVSCQGSVPEAIIAFLEGDSFEEVIRKAVSIGGDTDTIACMAGSIAETIYEIPVEIEKEVFKRMEEFTDELLVKTTENFRKAYCGVKS